MKHILIDLIGRLYKDYSKAQVVKFIQTHPEPFGISVVVDALKYWNIEHDLGSVSVEEIGMLPVNSILLFPSQKDWLIFREFKGDTIRVFHAKKGEFDLFVASLHDSWKGHVLLIDSDSEHSLPHADNRRWLPQEWSHSIIIAVALIMTALMFWHYSIVGILFFLSITGVILSISAYLEGKGISSVVVDGICRLGKSNNSCSTLLGSKSANIFGVPWSHLGIYYFFLHIYLISKVLICSGFDYLLEYDQILWFCAIPFITYSLIYQYMVSTIRCRVCLIIIALTIIGSVSAFINAPQLGQLEVSYALILEFLFFNIFLLAVLVFVESFVDRWKELLRKEKRYNGFLYDGSLLRYKLKQSEQIKDFTGLLSSKTGVLEPGLVIALSLGCTHCSKLFEGVMRYRDLYNSSVGFMLLPVGLTEGQLQVLAVINNSERWEEMLFFWYRIMTLKKAEKIFLKRYGTSESKLEGYSIESLKDFVIQNNINSLPRIYLQGFSLPPYLGPEDLIWYDREIYDL